jgi:hypothetical protein
MERSFGSVLGGRDDRGWLWWPSYEPDRPAVQSGLLRQNRALATPLLSNARINALVCMFNSFALAKPLCESMK